MRTYAVRIVIYFAGITMKVKMVMCFSRETCTCRCKIRLHVMRYINLMAQIRELAQWQGHGQAQNPNVSQKDCCMPEAPCNRTTDVFHRRGLYIPGRLNFTADKLSRIKTMTWNGLWTMLYLTELWTYMVSLIFTYLLHH